MSDQKELRTEPEFPPIDLHRHLEGSARIETILDLARQHEVSLPAYTVEALRPHVQVTEPLPDLRTFLKKNEIVANVLADYEACRRMAYECVEDAKLEGIVYLELRLSPMFLCRRHGYDPVGVVEAVIDGVKGGERDHGVRTNLIGVLARNYGPDVAREELEALLARREGIVALDLAGDEVNRPAALFAEHFRRGSEAGWPITIHAGEAAGPWSVWEAIRELGAQRIGHGTRAAEDPALMDYIAEKGIGVEANLTSNVQTSAVASYAEHPLRWFLKRDLLATISTDDPTTSAIDLAHEYEVAAPTAGLDRKLIRRAAGNAVELAFLSKGEKATLLREAESQAD